MKKITRPILLLLLAVLFPASVLAKDLTTPLDSYEPWPREKVDAFENLLIQDGGRVKPLYTSARFALMQFSGQSDLRFETKDGTKHVISHSEWLMDVLFRGAIAKELPTFIVDDSAAIVRFGVSPKDKRDRYSYMQLQEGRARLAELAGEYAQKQKQWEDSEKDPQYELDRIEGMVLTLGRNVSSYEYLLGQFGFARGADLLVNEDILPEELRQLAERIDIVEMMDKMPEMTLDQLVGMIRQPAGDSEDERLFTGALRLFFFHANSGRGLALFPPRDSNTEEWKSIGDVMLAGLESKDLRPWSIEQMQTVQALVQAAGTPEFAPLIREFTDSQHVRADARGEGQYSGLEIHMYEGPGGYSWFTLSLMFFVIAFVVMALSWLAPGSTAGRGLLIGAIVFAFIGMLLDAYGITLRSIIRQRPPITNLYDTILFITATAVFLGLVLEFFTRVGVGTLVAVLSGLLGMFLSIKYEAKEATDTITQLVAVLDTNFWLATHVIIINIGYAAAIVAGLLGIVYLAGRFTSGLLRRENRDFFRVLTRMNYGIICFCLFFSLVGTVLGGIWANYSWGRFWGWDPKENGALMICLWSLFILHGRMGGFLRDVGINMNAIVLAGITTFSWWGVNNLGVGLHSYGFTEGVWGALFLSWGIMGIFLAMGVPLWLQDRSRRKKPEPAAA